MELFESARFRSLVTGLLKQNKTPGMSIAIVQNDALASAGFGMANIEDSIPCTGDTLFDIASSAKSLTAASVALLIDDTKYPDVQYEALMSQLLPDDFVMQEKSYTDGITVEDVLSHRTGMASHDSSCMGPNAAQPDNARSITRNLRNLKAAAPLRSRYLYCNQMFTVATHLVEETSRKSFSDFLDERIFGPLQMDSTTLQPERAVYKGWGARMARGYIWENAWRGFDPESCPEGQGAGSIISSANDIIKWVKALLFQEGPINHRVYQGLTKMRSIVNPMSRRLKPHTTPANYTAGMEMYFYREKMVVGHDGCIPGFASRFIFIPDMNFGVVVLGNSARASGAATMIIRALMDDVLGVPLEEPKLQINSRGREVVESNIPICPTTSPVEQKDVHAYNSPKGRSNTQELSKADGSTEYQDVARIQGKGEKRKKGKKEKNTGVPQPQDQNKQGGKLQAQQSPETPQLNPLKEYVGHYWNSGYHTISVQTKDDQLFIDATDRSMGFTVTFKHVKNQTEYIAHVKDDLEFGDDPIAAEFVLENGKAMKLGLDLEPAIKEMIWFDRQNDSTTGRTFCLEPA